MADATQQRAQMILNHIERIIAYRNVQFIIDHQNDTLEQLSAYLEACMQELGHVPAKVEVIGGDYIEYRFETWKNAIRSFYSGKLASAKNPPPFAERQIVRALYEQLQRLGGETEDAAPSREVQQ